MKNVLSLLLAFIFLQTQTWALSGGPVYQNPASPNQAGIYSGVLVQKELIYNLFETGVQKPVDQSAGNIGIYSVTIPISGQSTGTTVLFVGGTVFTGTIDGVGDPDKRTFSGVIQATSTFDVVIQPAIRNAQGVIIEDEVLVTPIAQGQMTAKIIENIATPLAGRSNFANGNAARMTGKATVDAFISVDNNFAPVALVQAVYSVSGYRQTTTVLP